MGTASGSIAYKGVVFLLDSNLALLIYLIMIVIMIHHMNLNLVMMKTEGERRVLLMRAMSIADYLVKEGMVHEEKGIRYHHLIHRNSAGEEDWIVGADIDGKGNVVCVMRGVVDYESGKPSVIKVCAWD